MFQEDPEQSLGDAVDLIVEAAVRESEHFLLEFAQPGRGLYHDRFNQLILQARAELDEQRRRELYHDMQLILRDEGGVIVPMYANFISGAQTRSRKARRSRPTWSWMAGSALSDGGSPD